ncbi:MAG: hypothetical protein HYV63_26965 [Candidatus Schekmanbacteria bacterium]|nr:hypothetical protein [Candidatus Schekmanbacteria bacterium]
MAALLRPSIAADGVKIGDLERGTYAQLKLPAGRHRLQADQEKEAFDLSIAPEGFHCVTVEMLSGAIKGHCRMYGVSPIQCMAETQKLKYAAGLQDQRLVPAEQVTWPANLPGDSLPAPRETPKASVTIYYPQPEAGTGSSDAKVAWGARKVLVDGQTVAKIDDGRFFRTELNGGPHRFLSERAGLDLELSPGADYFLRLDADGTFYPVCGLQGTSEVQRLRLVDRD